MSSLTPATEVAIWSLFFNGTYWPGIAQRDTSQIGVAGFWLSLHNGDPSQGNAQDTAETTYGNYGRVYVPRVAGQWTVTGSQPTVAMNANQINFPVCQQQGDTISYWGLGAQQSGTGQLFMSAPVSNTQMYGFTGAAGTPGTLQVPGSTLVLNDPVVFYALEPASQLPAGLAQGVTYYVGRTIGSSITLSLAPGNVGPVALQSAGAGVLIPVAPMVVVPAVGNAPSTQPSFPATALQVFLN